jgi:hypothetical protein
MFQFLTEVDFDVATFILQIIMGKVVSNSAAKGLLGFIYFPPPTHTQERLFP